MKDNQHEQLFTELTSEEAAVIEGGAFVQIDRIQAIRAGADVVGKDDTYITIGGRKVGSTYELDTGDSANVYQGRTFSGSTRVALFDADGFLQGSDDPLGSFTVSGPTNGTVLTRVSGSGSTYDVYYKVFA